MILPFSTQLNGKPTYFVEKIWEGILLKGIQFKTFEMKIGIGALPENYKVKTNLPKLHTIREDKKNRWKPGVMIDFFINTRTKDMFRFAPRIPVVSTQEIKIVYYYFETLETKGIRILNGSLHSTQPISLRTAEYVTRMLGGVRGSPC